MGITEWIIANKTNIGWVGGGIVATYKFLLVVYKKMYLPIKKQYDNLTYQMNNDSGKSLIDLAQRMDKNIEKLTAVSEGLLMLNDQAIFRCDIDGRCVFANQALCELYGATREDMLGHGWLNFIKQSEREDAKKNWENSVENDNQVNYQYTVINGHTFTEIKCKYTAVIKRDEAHNIISILGIVSKI